MVEKNVIVQYKLDWKKQLFGVLFTYEKLENTFSVLFEKNKMVQQGVEFAEEINTWLDNPKEYRVNVCKIGLNAREKEELHTLFPYVPVFTTIKQFWNLYNEYQGTQIFDTYREMTHLKNKLLRGENAPDGEWHWGQLSSGEACIWCKWKDLQGVVHALVMNKETYASDLTYSQIKMQEYLLEGHLQMGELHKFAQLNQELYHFLSGGGRKVFSFLTSEGTNEKVRALLGKAGLGKLSDCVEKYQGLAHHKKDVQEIFGVPFEVLKACNDGEDDMLVYPNERQLLKKAFEENAAIFHTPLTTIASMWIHRYYSNLFYLYKNNCMELGLTIQYLNEQVEHQKEKNPYVIFVTYYNYLIYLNRCKTAYEMYPENLIMAEKMIAKEMVI